MATYTPNYGLHQWVPEDTFLRTDFNEDFQKIDTALGGTEVSGREMGYHVLNLLMGADEETGFTQWAKAPFIFDSFRNLSKVQTLGSGLALDSEQTALVLNSAGQSTVDVNLGNTYGFSLNSAQSRSYEITTTGAGRLDSVELYYGGTLRFEIKRSGSTMVNTTAQGSCSGSLKGSSKAVSAGFTFGAGETLEVTVTNTGSSSIYLYYKEKGKPTLGLRFNITPTVITSANVTSATYQTERTARGALGWVRGNQATFSLSLAQRSMTLTGTRTTTTSQGVTCVESAFRLDEPLSGSLSAAISLQTTQGNKAELYEYGILLL